MGSIGYLGCFYMAAADSSPSLDVGPYRRISRSRDALDACRLTCFPTALSLSPCHRRWHQPTMLSEDDQARLSLSLTLGVRASMSLGRYYHDHHQDDDEDSSRVHQMGHQGHMVLTRLLSNSIIIVTMVMKKKTRMMQIADHWLRLVEYTMTR